MREFMRRGIQKSPNMNEAQLRTFVKLLANEYSLLDSVGVICVCVDGRGTGARGETFRKCTYLKLGELESRDQIEGKGY